MSRILLILLLLCTALSTYAQVQVKHYTCWNGFEVSEGDTIRLNTDIPTDIYNAIYKDKVLGKREYLTTADNESYVVVRRVLRFNTGKLDETAHLSVYGVNISKYTLEIDKAIDSNELLMPEGFVATPRQPNRTLQYTTNGGVIYRVGDPVVMAKGTAPKGKFMYLRAVSDEHPSMYPQAFSPTSIHTYAYEHHSGRTFYIQKIQYYQMDGEDRVYFLMGSPGLGLRMFVLDIENAITMREILVEDK